MAIVATTETWASDVDGQVDERLFVVETASRELDLLSDDPINDNENTAKAALPAYNSVHPRLGTAFRLKNKSLIRTSPIMYKATLGYETPSQKEDQQEEPPWNSPTTVDFYPITQQEPVDEDFTGQPYQNANGEPYQGLTRPITDLGIRLRRAFQTFSAPAFYLFQDAVNSVAYLGFDPGLLKIVAINATEATYGDPAVIYYNVQTDIAARKPYRVAAAQAWYRRLLHQGYLVRESAGAEPVRAVDEQNEYVSKPILLAADGTALGAGSPVWLTRQQFDEVDFAGMGYF